MTQSIPHLTLIQVKKQHLVMSLGSILQLATEKDLLSIKTIYFYDNVSLSNYF